MRYFSAFSPPDNTDRWLRRASGQVLARKFKGMRRLDRLGSKARCEESGSRIWMACRGGYLKSCVDQGRLMMARGDAKGAETVIRKAYDAGVDESYPAMAAVYEARGQPDNPIARKPGGPAGPPKSPLPRLRSRLGINIPLDRDLRWHLDFSPCFFIPGRSSSKSRLDGIQFSGD